MFLNPMQAPPRLDEPPGPLREMPNDAACSPAFYPTTMTSQGCAISASTAARSYAAWALEDYRGGYIRLSAWIERFAMLDGGTQPSIDAGYRLADRIIQRARKAGLIRPVKPRGWAAVE